MTDISEHLRHLPKEKLENLMNEPETQQVFSLLSETINGSLEKAAEKAASGDSAQLISAIKQMLQNPEAANLIRKMQKKIR